MAKNQPEKNVEFFYWCRQKLRAFHQGIPMGHRAKSKMVTPKEKQESLCYCFAGFLFPVTALERLWIMLNSTESLGISSADSKLIL